MSGAASGNRRNLVAWIRLDSNGNIIPGSEQYRPRGVQPKNGTWRQVTSSYCCDCYCMITFQNNASYGSIESITTADGAIDWSGTLSAGDTISFVIPSCYDEAFTVQFGTITGGIIVNIDLVQGSGTQTIDNDYLTSLVTTTHIDTSVGTCAQWLVKFSND